MSLLRDALRGAREIALLKYKVDEQGAAIAALTLLHNDTRERVLRLEGYVDGVRTGRALPPPGRR